MVSYLKSYEHMGSVRVDCMHQCACEPLVIDAHNLERISPLDLVYFSARIQRQRAAAKPIGVRRRRPPCAPQAEPVGEGMIHFRGYQDFVLDGRRRTIRPTGDADDPLARKLVLARNLLAPQRLRGVRCIDG